MANYEQSQSSADVVNSLDSSVKDGSISATTAKNIEAILGLNTAKEVNVASSDGTTWTQPAGKAVDMAVVNADGKINIPLDILQTTKAFVFNSIKGVDVNFNVNPPTAAVETPVVQDRVIAGSAGNDNFVVQDNSNSTIDGGQGNDTVIAAGGNDSVTAGQGNDSVNAGSGFDTLNMVGKDYDIVVQNGQLVITSKVNSTTEKTTTVAKNVEFITFGDNNTTGIAVVANEQEAQAQRLYKAIFNRDADRDGSQYWSEQVKNGFDLHSIAQCFIESPESQSMGQLTDEQFVEKLYNNALGRPSDAAGKAYWLDQLATGALDRASVALCFVGSSEGQSTIDNVIIVSGNV